ncbi:MAG: ABC transporter substrate-binding protein [Bacteroidota bacterium]
MANFKLALDWTPNINHIGFFVAREKGFYETVNMQIDISDPSADNYQITPAKKVELDQADFALCPTESIISYRTKQDPFPLLALAALLQEDLSAIVVKKDSGIHSPKDLDGKTYSSYKARYEDAIVKEMIKNDGGQGNLQLVYPEKLGIWNTLLDGRADATWIFINWEGVAAEQVDVSLSYFRLSDYNIPYSYSPVIAADASKIEANRTRYKQFLHASKQGFLYAQANPEESVAILSKFIPEYDRHIDLSRALEITAPHFGTEDNWGTMEERKMQVFLNWLEAKELETTALNLQDLMARL